MSVDIEKETEQLLANKSYELFNQLINTAPPKLLAMYKDHVFIFAPQFMIKYLKKHFDKYIQYTDSVDDVTFAGYKVKLHFNNELVIAHIDFAITKDLNTINRVKV